MKPARRVILSVVAGWLTPPLPRQNNTGSMHGVVKVKNDESDRPGRRTNRILSVVFACLVAAGPLTCSGFPVAAQTLSNGLKVLVHEDHDIPNVALYLFFRTGSRNERPGKTGLAHFVEHMMFNGEAAPGEQGFDAVMEKHGGTNNAYTTRDVTVYSDFFPSAALESVLSQEARRLANPAFAEGMIESERQVVLSERQTAVDQDPLNSLCERLLGVLYGVHPYRWPVLGRAADIQSWTIHDVRDFFSRGYGADNCVMIAVGDVTAARFFALVAKHFSAIARGSAQALPDNRAEPRQARERRVHIEKTAYAPILVAAYHVPESRNADYWPLQVMSTVLTGGRGSRLYRRLVRRDRGALSVSSWQRLSLEPGELMFTLRLRRDAGLAPVERAFAEELGRLKSSEVSNRELRAAKNKLLMELARDTRTNSGKADWLGTYEIYFGSYRKLFLAPDAIERVEARDVRRVARRYLRPENRAVATLKTPALDVREGAR